MLSAIQSHPFPRVLIIEDDPALLIIQQRLWERMGCEATTVSNAFLAMPLFSEQWDFIVIDIGLPDMNGIDLCRLFRKFERKFGGHTPIMAYTAFGNTIEKQCQDAGFDSFYIKPLSNEKLYQIAQNHLPHFCLTPLKTGK